MGEGNFRNIWNGVFAVQVWIFLASFLVTFVSVIKILKYLKLLRTKIMSVQTILEIMLRQSVNLERRENKLSVAMTLLVFVVTGGCTCKLYECMLTSSTSLSPVIRPIDTISDMVDAIMNRDYLISSVQGSAFYEAFLTSKVEFVKIFAQSTLNRNFVVPKTPGELIRKMLNEKIATVGSRLGIQRKLVEMNQPLETVHCGRETLFISHIAVALRKEFPCRDDLVNWINILVDTGLIDKWSSEETTIFNQSTKITDHVGASSYIAMSDLKLTFVVLLCGYLCGFVSLLLEMMTKHC